RLPGCERPKNRPDRMRRDSCALCYAIVRAPARVPAKKRKIRQSRRPRLAHTCGRRPLRRRPVLPTIVNLTLYLLTVLIWGTTWIAIKLQLGVVAIPVSIFYRFALAALIMMAALALLRKLQKLDLRGHLLCLGQGL